MNRSRDFDFNISPTSRKPPGVQTLRIRFELLHLSTHLEKMSAHFTESRQLSWSTVRDKFGAMRTLCKRYQHVIVCLMLEHVRTQNTYTHSLEELRTRNVMLQVHSSLNMCVRVCVGIV